MSSTASPSVMLLITLFLLSSCSGGKVEESTKSTRGDLNPSQPPGIEPSKPTQFQSGLSFQWQLQGAVDRSHDVDVYDIDLEENEHNGIILDLKNQGRRVIRIERAAAAGCDAVEPDNVDAYQNDPGFPLTMEDQISYLRYLAELAHNENLSIGLKNAVDLISAGQLDELFDFALNESCYTYNECDSLKVFISKNKAVFVVEYNSARLSHCDNAKTNGFELMIFNSNLDNSSREVCP